MAERVFLHVGTPKSGTTYLQSVLWQNREQLRADGLLVPGRRLRDHNLAAQGLRLDPAAVPGRRAATWKRFLEHVRGWPHDAVISNEWLTRTTPEQAARALAALAPAEVHVVVTARDLSAQAPAAWQESVKVGHAASLEEFIVELDSSTARWTWASLDPAQVLETWAGLVPVERLHVVTVPAHGADPALLWQRVGSLLGLLDPAGYDATRRRTNESLSAEAAALMWRIGPGLREAVTDGGAAGWVEPFRWVRNYVSHDMLAAYAGSRIALRPAEQDLVSKRSELIAHALIAAGYDLVGDLADLRPAAPPTDGRHPGDVTAEEMLALAGRLLADMLARARAESQRGRSH